MSYPTPDQVENCGPAEAVLLVKQFVAAKLNEIFYSVSLDKYAFRYLYFQRALLNIKLRQCNAKFGPVMAVPVADWDRLLGQRCLEIIRKALAIYDKYRKFKERYTEVVTSRNDAFFGLDAIRYSPITQANAQRILQEMWSDPRYVNWSKITFGELEVEWKNLHLVDDAEDCLVAWENLLRP